MYFWSMANFAAALVYFWLIMISLSRNPKGLLNRVFALLALLFFIWSLSSVFYFPSPTIEEANFWLRMAAIGWTFFAGAYFWFTLAFTRKKRILSRWYFYPLLFAVPTALIIAQFTVGITVVKGKASYGWESGWLYSPWTWVHYAYYGGLMIASVILYFHYYFHTKFIHEKKQIRLILSTTVSTLIVGTTTDLIISRTLIPGITSVLAVSVGIGIGVAIIKYRMLYLTPAHAAENILTTMSDALLLFDPEGLLSEANPAALALTGYELSEIRGAKPERFFPNCWPLPSEYAGKQSAPDKVTERRIILKTAGGMDIPVSFSGSVLRDAGGTAIGAVCTVRDLRETLRAEEKERELLLEKTRAQTMVELSEDLRRTNDRLIMALLERKKAQEALQSSLDEKTVLLKEVHHRVKNNLQIICSLLNLQARGTENPEAQEIMRDSINRVRSMALLHESLYRAGSLARIDLTAYIESLCSNLSFSHIGSSQVVLERRLSPVSLGLDQAVSAGLIINELVVNALKHGFPEGRAGRITVEVKNMEGSTIMLTVSDDGIGLPENLNTRETETLGYQLVHMLADRLAGTIRITREGGTAFHISFQAQ